ncbi:hypothetical protein [Burkholderia ambifaria]|uniref:hypothetical protein n=1 Tax=Burkholderia ambifaria TaxID=152480 RepID=UPI002FE3C154
MLTALWSGLISIHSADHGRVTLSEHFMHDQAAPGATAHGHSDCHCGGQQPDFIEEPLRGRQAGQDIVAHIASITPVVPIHRLP